MLFPGDRQPASIVMILPYELTEGLPVPIARSRLPKRHCPMDSSFCGCLSASTFPYSTAGQAGSFRYSIRSTVLLPSRPRRENEHAYVMVSCDLVRLHSLCKLIPASDRIDFRSFNERNMSWGSWRTVRAPCLAIHGRCDRTSPPLTTARGRTRTADD
jgi:hypothetical protein